MAKRRRNVTTKIVIELTIRGDVEAASDLVEEMLDQGTLQDVFEEAVEDKYDGDDLPEITDTRVFIES